MNKKEAIKLLKAARKILVKDEESFVCYAISDAYGCSNISFATYFRLRTLINDSLCAYSSVVNWLKNTHPVAYKRICDREEVDPFKTYRIAWIDEMIKQVKNGELND